MPRLDAALRRLAEEGSFSGAVVIRSSEGVAFARGYGFADPFTGRPFDPATPVDSASLAKPITAASVLLLVRSGLIDLDAAVARYLPEFPYPGVTVRQLLTHSAGLPNDGDLEPLASQNNADLLATMRSRGLSLRFPPGTGFNYCNTCYTTLALLIERVTRRGYLEVLQDSVALPTTVTIRPRSLQEWQGRAIGFRRSTNGTLERADSYEGEAFYGSSNLSISALALAEWGSRWWTELAPVRIDATLLPRVGGGMSGLALGNWYCTRGGRRCHYLGHHEGFHHLLYWDVDRRLSVAMVTNNSLAPDLQQRLQRALVAFATGRPETASRELQRRLAGRQAIDGTYRTTGGERVTISAVPGGPFLRLIRRSVAYTVYPVGHGIGYAPGLDLYVTANERGRLQMLSLYEDWEAARVN